MGIEDLFKNWRTTACCDRCHLPVPHPFQTKRLYTIWESKTLRLCPHCYQQLFDRDWPFLFGLLLLIIGALAVVVAFFPAALWAWIILEAALLIGSVLVIYEIMQIIDLVAAFALGLRVYWFRVGFGVTVHMRGQFQIGFNPRDLGKGSGLMYAFPITQWSALKHFLFAMIELLGLVAVAVVLFHQIDFREWQRPWDELLASVHPRFSLLVACCYWLVIQFFGWGIIFRRSFFGKVPKEHRLDRHFLLTEASLAFSEHRYAAAREWIDRGLALYPADTELLILSAYCANRSSNFDLARAACQAIIEKQESTPQYQARAMTILIWLNQHRLLAVDLPESERYALRERQMRYCEETIEKIGNQAEEFVMFMETFGAVAMEFGHEYAGETILQSLFERAASNDDKAYCLCFLAISAMRHGKIAQAQTMLGRARDLDPTCVFLAPADKLLAVPNTMITNEPST